MLVIRERGSESKFLDGLTFRSKIYSTMMVYFSERFEKLFWRLISELKGPFCPFFRHRQPRIEHQKFGRELGKKESEEERKKHSEADAGFHSG